MSIGKQSQSRSLRAAIMLVALLLFISQQFLLVSNVFAGDVEELDQQLRAAKQHYQNDKLDQAVALLREILHQEDVPDGIWKEAHAYLGSAYVAQQEDLRAKLERAKNYYAEANFDEAIELLTEITTEPEVSDNLRNESYTYLGAAYVGQRELNKAKSAFKKILKQDPKIELDPAEFTRKVRDVWEQAKIEVGPSVISKKPVYKKAWFWVIVGGAAAGGIAAASGGGGGAGGPDTGSLGITVTFPGIP